MPVPDAYTEEALAAAMNQWVSTTAVLLGWSVDDGSYDDPIIDALSWYGVTDIANATDVKKLRALARVAVWESAASALASSVDWSRGAESVRSSQAYENALKQLAAARKRAADEGYTIGPVAALVVSDIVYHDPYARTTRKAL